MSWSKKPIEWIDNGTAFISVPFTWNLPEVYSRCVWLGREGYKVNVGGPAVGLMWPYLSDVAIIGGGINALWRHNPDATFTSRGCIRKCPFCAVPRLEPQFVELSHWEPRPIICDNNLLACSKKHFDKVVDSLKPFTAVDFNQGLDARLLNSHHIQRLTELDLKVIRLAWDHIKEERVVRDAIMALTAAGIPKHKIHVYVLIGYDDNPDDALYRLQTLKSIGVWPNPQRYNPLDTLVRDSYVAANWTDRQLKRYMRYWARQAYLEHIPFEDYKG